MSNFDEESVEGIICNPIYAGIAEHPRILSMRGEQRGEKRHGKGSEYSLSRKLLTEPRVRLISNKLTSPLK
jgi:hypothetical protein